MVVLGVLLFGVSQRVVQVEIGTMGTRELGPMSYVWHVKELIVKIRIQVYFHVKNKVMV